MPFTSRLAILVLSVVLLLVFIPVLSLAEPPSPDRVFVYGAVKRPGEYVLDPGMDVKKAINVAGGLTETADISNATLARVNKEIIPLNLEEILLGKQTVLLQPGDTIAVKTAVVKIEGHVRQPGTYELRQGMTSRDALNVASGPTEIADLAGAYITRNGEIISANLDTPASATPLKANDVMTIPQITASITGEIPQPGSYPIVLGQTDNLAGLIRSAGGVTAKADLKNVRITSLKGTEKPVNVVDASDAVKQQSIKINSGDAVFIPQVEKKNKKRFNINQVSQVALIIYTLTQIFGR